MPSKVAKTVKAVLSGVAAFYFSVLALLYVLQGYLTFPAPVFGSYDLPETAVFVPMQTSDGVRINHVRLENGAGAPKLIFFHGNASTAAYSVDIGSSFHDAGFDVLLAEYRGYGTSEGSPSAEKLKADSLETHDFFKGNSDQPVFVLGHSLGTGIGAYLASEREVTALSLVGSYASLADVAAGRYPVFPVRTLFANEIAASEYLRDVDIPIQIIHGSSDRIIPIKFGRALYESLSSSNKQFLEMHDSGHNGIFRDGATDKAIEFFTDYRSVS